VCIEGVPEHVLQAISVTSLFPRPSFVDDEPCDIEKPEEECLRLWVWTSEPEGIPISATLQVEEPVTMPQEGYTESLIEMGVLVGPIRIDQAEVLDYEVLVHVDRVLDYTPLSASPSHQCARSDISGIPDDELELKWPAHHPFMWRLGVPDSERRRAPKWRRPSVFESIEDRGWDRSPPRGGGSSGLGLRRAPLSGLHDIPSLLGRGQARHGQG
jgi:hypothetical protein